MPDAKQAEQEGHGLQRYHFDAFARSITATVLACDPVPEDFTFEAAPASKSKREGKKGKKGQSTAPAQSTQLAPTHILRLSDTVLFAEGGGQPYDTGLIDGRHQVVRVLRAANAKDHQKVKLQATVDDALPLHYVCLGSAAGLQQGSSVEVSVDWERRHYHMQQHSAQHLISAIAERKFKWSTTSWWLGADKCNIEFLAEAEATPVTAERLSELEALANERIRAALPVTVSVLYNREDNPLPGGDDSSTTEDIASPAGDSSDRKSKARHQGRATRVVAIDEGRTDSNQCCGTHVANTAQLQCVKLLGSEPARGQVRVFFVAGNHAMELFDAVLTREAAMTALVCTRPEEHASLVSRTIAEHRAMAKEIKGLMAELADFHAERLIAELSCDGRAHSVISLHRDVGDMAFAGAVATLVTAKVPSAVCLITCGNEAPFGPSHPHPGIFLLACDKDNKEFDLQTAGKAVATALSARGGGRAPRFQGKSPDLRERDGALQALLATL